MLNFIGLGLLFLVFENKKMLNISPEKGDYYTNEQGYRVFTEQYHLKRGYCCRSGCKHCPYGFDKNTDSFKKIK